MNKLHALLVRVLTSRWPSTKVLVGLAASYVTLSVAWAATQLHWTADENTAVAGFAFATLALAGFTVEHLRRETPSRWVGVIGLIPATLITAYTVAATFGWGQLNPSSVAGATGLITALFTPIATLAGVGIVQARVTSPETLQRERADAATPAAILAAMNPKLHPPT